MSSTPIAGGTLGTVPVGLGPSRSTPVGTITAPIGSIDESTFTATWTYSSVTSRAQLGYRVRVLTDGGTELYDSGLLSGADLSYDVPYLLSSGLYSVELTVDDGIDQSVSSSEFSVLLSTVPEFDPEPGVGRIYEIGINGEGYMLADTLQTPLRRQVGSLQAPRFAVGDTPFSEAIDRYTFLGQDDWSGGEGQTLGDRPRSTSDRFFRSEGLDVFGLDGGLSLLPATDLIPDEDLILVTAVLGTSLFALNTDAEILLAWDGATSFTADQDAGEITSMGDVVDLTSDGNRIYALTASNGIWYRTLAGSWTQLTVSNYGSERQSLTWTGDRLTMVYDDSGDGTVSTIASDGTEEGNTFAFPDLEVHSVTAGDGYVFFAVGTSIYSWQLGSSDSRALALSLPPGQEVLDLHFYLGNVIVFAATENTSDVTNHIYRAIPSGGALTPELVCEFTTTELPDRDRGLLVGNGRLVHFAWPEMMTTGAPGVGAIDLSTGGYSRWLSGEQSGDEGDTWVAPTVAYTGGLFVRAGRLGFNVATVGICEQSADLRETGFVVSSARDLGSSLTKVIDEIQLSWAPLPQDAGVTADLSVNDGGFWHELGSSEVAGTTGAEFSAGYETSSVMTRLTLTGDGSVTPEVRATALKVHPLTLTDDIIELPVNCGPRLVGLNGVELPDQLASVQVIRRLEALTGTRVLFQDTDWPTTAAGIWEAVSVDSTSVGVYDRSVAKRREASAVAVVTLRRAS